MDVFQNSAFSHGLRGEGGSRLIRIKYCMSLSRPTLLSIDRLYSYV